MRCLVTGGAGFIGSHVVDALLDAGHEVLAIDNFATGKRGNLNPAAAFEEVDLVTGDVETIFRRFRPEIVNHHAAQASVGGSTKDALGDARVNVIGTVRLLEAARSTGVRKVVYAQTGGAMYGAPLYVPVDEAHPIAPLSPYAVSKTAAEQYLRVYEHLYGLAWTSLRYANIYGPRQDPHGEAGVVAIFTSRMLAGEAPTIFGSGTDDRDYVYVADIARANLLAMDRADGRALNIGTGVGTNVLTIWDELARLAEFKGERVHGAPRAGDVPSMRLSAALAEAQLDWRPQITFPDGLRRTVEWFVSRAS